MTELCKDIWRTIFESYIRDYPTSYSQLARCISHDDNKRNTLCMEAVCISPILAVLHGLTHYLNAGKKMGWVTCEEVRCVERFTEDARQFISEHITIFSKCFALESSVFIKRYRHEVSRLDNAPEYDLLDDLSNCLVYRDSVEFCLRTCEFLHKDLVVSEEMKSIVHNADDKFRLVAPELWWKIRNDLAPMTEDYHCRQLIELPSGNWWWWLRWR